MHSFTYLCTQLADHLDNSTLALSFRGIGCPTLLITTLQHQGNCKYMHHISQCACQGAYVLSMLLLQKAGNSTLQRGTAAKAEQIMLSPTTPPHEKGSPPHHPPTQHSSSPYELSQALPLHVASLSRRAPLCCDPKNWIIQDILP